MVLGAVIGGVASAVFGGAAAASQARAQNKANAQLAKYNKQLWNFNWEQDNRNRDFQILQNSALRSNNADDRAYAQATQIRDFQYSQMMDTARYNAELAAYKKSDDLTKAQLQLNQAGLDLALKQQAQFMSEQELNYTFRTAELGTQLQSALNQYTLSMFDESLSRQIADQERDKTKMFSSQTRDLAIGQANQDFGLTSELSNKRTAITKAQADADLGLTSAISDEQTAITKVQAAQDYALTIESSKLRKNIDIGQAGESAALASKNAQDRFGNQVKNAKGEQDALRTSTSREQEMAAIEGMQRKGAAKAGQAGRSSIKLAQSMGFIAGMNQAALSDRILFGEKATYRQIADAGLAMQQSVDQSSMQAKQTMQNAALNDTLTQASAKVKRDQTFQSADFSNRSTKAEAQLSRDKTFQSADFGNYQTQSEALLRRNQTADSANLTDLQNRTEAELRRSQAYSASEMRIKRADNELANTKAGIDLGMSGALASLISARISNEYTNSGINADKYAADLNAYANKMLEPMAPIARPAPLLLPEPIILDPPKLVKPPKPVAGANVSVSAAFMGGAASGIGQAIGGIVDAIK